MVQWREAIKRKCGQASRVLPERLRLELACGTSPCNRGCLKTKMKLSSQTLAIYQKRCGKAISLPLLARSFRVTANTENCACKLYELNLSVLFPIKEAKFASLCEVQRAVEHPMPDFVCKRETGASPISI